MICPSRIIEALQSTQSRLEKEDILKKAWADGCTEFFEGAKIAYSPLITFGIKKLPTISQRKISNDLFEIESPLNFFELAKKLQVRELTGHAAQNAVKDFANACDPDKWNMFYSKVLLKDLRAGISSKTINKVLNSIKGTAQDYIIPIFSCALAQDSSNNTKKMSGLKMVQPKYDGIRMLAVIYPNSEVTLYTRNGRINENFATITNKLQKLSKECKTPIVIDGEIISHNFQLLMTQVNRKKDIDTTDAKFIAFDYLPLDKFLEGEYKCSSINRYNFLQQLIESNYTEFNDDGAIIKMDKHINVVDNLLINIDLENDHAKMIEYKDHCLDAGLEGIMIKDANSSYECKRSANWLKFKPNLTLDLTIVSVEEGTGRNIGRLGNINCSGVSEKNETISVSVGSGFSDDQRIEFWQHRDKLPGMVIEVKADCVTQNQDGSYSLRFPRFIRFRGILPGEKF